MRTFKSAGARLRRPRLPASRSHTREERDMADICRYILVDRDNRYIGGYFSLYSEAVDAAERGGCAVVAHTFEYSDEDLVWTPKGSGHWPEAEESEEEKED